MLSLLKVRTLKWKLGRVISYRTELKNKGKVYSLDEEFFLWTL